MTPTVARSSNTDGLACTQSASQAPDGPVRIYVLIDQSFSANVADGDGHKRLAMLGQVADFATGYGWLANTPPYLYLYAYSTVFGDTDQNFEGPEYTKLLWPTDQLGRQVEIQKSTLGNYGLDELYGTVAPMVLRDLKPTSDLGQVENLPVTLDYIKKLIGQSGQNSHNKSLVVILTQGELIGDNAGAKNIREELNVAAQIWAPSSVPIAVYTFSSLYQDDWRDQFIKKLDEDPAIFLDTMYDRNIWNSMLSIYEQLGLIGQGSQEGVFSGQIESGQRTAPNFSPDTEMLDLVSLSLPNERLSIDGDYGAKYDTDYFPSFQFDYWHIDHGPISTLISTNNVMSSVQFIYNCRLAPAKGQNPTIPAPTPTTPPHPPLPPISYPEGQLLALLIIAVVGFLCYFTLPRWGINPLLGTPAVLSFLDILLVLWLLYKRTTGLSHDLVPNLYIWLAQSIITTVWTSREMIKARLKPNLSQVPLLPDPNSHPIRSAGLVTQIVYSMLVVLSFMAAGVFVILMGLTIGN
jgi:hypothetical protein